MSSKSVARSAGLRSIRRSPRWPPFPSASPGFRRPVARSVQVSPVGFVCISSVRFVPSVCCSFQFVCSFRSRFVFRSSSVQFSSSCSVRLSFGSSFSDLVRFRLVRFSFVSFRSHSVWFLVQVRFSSAWFCARAFSRAGLLYYSRVYYTLHGAKGK